MDFIYLMIDLFAMASNEVLKKPLVRAIYFALTRGYHIWIVKELLNLESKQRP